MTALAIAPQLDTSTSRRQTLIVHVNEGEICSSCVVGLQLLGSESFPAREDTHGTPGAPAFKFHEHAPTASEVRQELDLKLGQRVAFAHPITRRTAKDPDTGVVRRFWARPETQEPPAREGVIIGARTLANGVLSQNPELDGRRFLADRWFRAYLVSFDMRMDPICVLPEDITLPFE
jgi:hypothetical protein